MDFVQWTQPSPTQDPDNWYTIKYKYDPGGRRIEKDVDGDTTTYVYDGGNVIAEYDDNDDLASKYIHGARVDELVCMIDVADSSAVYYYHYDGLGSVVALSNSSGNSCQSYVYSAYGRVWAEYPEFKANPYMFTGRRFDYETGLYYYRARYYNPYIGRFIQTDPVGYDDGINWYVYCRNNPIIWTDPTGNTPVGFHDVNYASDDAWAYVLNLENFSVTGISGEWNLEGLSTTFEVAPWDMYTISDSCDLSLKPLYPEDYSWWSSMDDSVVGTSSIIDSFDDISLSPWNPRFIPNPVPMPDNKTWKPPSIPFIPEQTPEQVKEFEDLFKEGMGEDATGRDAMGNSSYLTPKSGGGGIWLLLAPWWCAPPEYWAVPISEQGDISG